MYHVSRVDNLSWHFAISDYEDFLWLAVTRLIIFKFQSLANRPLTNSNISSFEASWNFESSVRIQESLQTCRELNSCSVRFLFFRKLKLWLFLAPQGCPIQLTHDISFSFHGWYGSVCCFYLLQHQKNQHFKLIRPTSSQDGMFVGKAFCQNLASQVINLSHKTQQTNLQQHETRDIPCYTVPLPQLSETTGRRYPNLKDWEIKAIGSINCVRVLRVQLLCLVAPKSLSELLSRSLKTKTEGCLIKILNSICLLGDMQSVGGITPVTATKKRIRAVVASFRQWCASL